MKPVQTFIFFSQQRTTKQSIVYWRRLGKNTQGDSLSPTTPNSFQIVSPVKRYFEQSLHGDSATGITFYLGTKVASFRTVRLCQFGITRQVLGIYKPDERGVPACHGIVRRPSRALFQLGGSGPKFPRIGRRYPSERMRPIYLRREESQPWCSAMLARHLPLYATARERAQRGRILIPWSGAFKAVYKCVQTRVNGEVVLLVSILLESPVPFEEPCVTVVFHLWVSLVSEKW